MSSVILDVIIQAFEKFMESTANILPPVSTASPSDESASPIRPPGDSSSSFNKSRPRKKTSSQIQEPLELDIDLDECPEVFLCPITLEIMSDPVIAADGHTYERGPMEDWLKSHDTSPTTNAALSHIFLIPNHSIRGLIMEYIDDKNS